MKRIKGPRPFAAAAIKLHIEDIPNILSDDAIDEFFNNADDTGNAGPSPEDFFRDNLSEFFKYFGLTCWNSEEEDGFFYVGLPIEAWTNDEYRDKDDFIEDAGVRLSGVVNDEAFDAREFGIVVDRGSLL